MATVYIIRNTITGCVYVGGTRWKTSARFNQHKSRLNHGQGNFRIQPDWQTFGPSAFSFETLEADLPEERLREREQYWLRVFRRRGPVYNLWLNVRGPRGYRPTEESNRKRSQSLKGRRKSPGFGAKVSAALKGKKKSAEHVAAMTRARRNRIDDAETTQRNREQARKNPVETLKQIFILAASGMKQNAIAEKLGLSKATVSLTLSGKRNRDLMPTG